MQIFKESRLYNLMEEPEDSVRYVNGRGQYHEIKFNIKLIELLFMTAPKLKQRAETSCLNGH